MRNLIQTKYERLDFNRATKTNFLPLKSKHNCVVMKEENVHENEKFYYLWLRVKIVQRL